MANRLVTCPETAHLELIEYDDTSCGMLIHSCTRFRAPWALSCSRACAARLDRRDRTFEASIDVGDETCLDVLGALRNAS